MANRPKGYGMTAELANKTAAKYDAALAGEAMDWIKAVVPDTTDVGSNPSSDQVLEALKDGKTLCKLINAIQPGSVKKINESKMAFKMMENIGKFLDACTDYGVVKTDMFQTVDLYEGANMPQVINGIQALGRKAQAKGFSGPSLGPRESSANAREFTEEQLRQGQSHIGLQMGSNKGATQAGMNIGNTRHIID